jgi:salicylate hydroxylase
VAIAIVGAGIGGLTTALALARKGFAVDLIERRGGFSEIGAGLQLSPNASRILVDLGLGAALRRVVGEPERVIIRSIRSGNEIGRIALGPYMRNRYGAPYWVAHRADLQTVLLDAVRSDPKIRLIMGRTVEAVGEAEGGVVLGCVSESGTREALEAEAVVGADGVWSKIRPVIDPGEKPAFAGHVAWRATLPKAKVPSPLSGNETGLWLGKTGHVVHYPIAGGKLLNVVVIERTNVAVDGWAARGEGVELIRQYTGASPLLLQLLSRDTSWQRWSLFERHPQRIAQGRVALLGDAAHPVLPFLAQGAALAIEDAAKLAEMMTLTDDLRLAFEMYETERLGRARRVQSEASRNGRIYHLSGPVAFARNVVIGRLGAERMTSRYDWLYGHKPNPRLASEVTDG